MIKTTLKIDGMMCGMCEAHMNDLIRSNFKVKKVTSSARKGETVVFSEEMLDISLATKLVKNIGYELKGHSSTEEVNGLQSWIQKIRKQPD